MTYVCMLHNYVIMKENITSDYIYMYHISGGGTKLNFGEASSLVHAIVITFYAYIHVYTFYSCLYVCVY